MPVCVLGAAWGGQALTELWFAVGFTRMPVYAELGNHPAASAGIPQRELTGRLRSISPKVNLLGWIPRGKLTGCRLVASSALWPRKAHSVTGDQLCK